MKTMKRSVLLVSAVFAMASTAAIAEDAALEKPVAATSKAVTLTDAELDNITAGSASVATVVFNPGNASVLHVNDSIPPTNAHCVNCTTPNPFGGKARIILIQNPAQTVFKCMGAAAGALPGC